MQFTLSKSTLISIIVVSILILGGVGYMLGQGSTNPNPSTELAIETTDPIDKTTPQNEETEEIREEKPQVQEIVLPQPSGISTPTPGQICARDRTEKRDNSLTPFLATDLSRLYVEIESLELVSKNLDREWKRYAEELREEEGKEEEYNRAYYQASKIGSIPNTLHGFMAITGLMSMYDCAIRDESGKNTCLDTPSWAAMKVDNQLDTDDRYIRTFSPKDAAEDYGQRFIFEGKVGDPGNHTFTMVEEDNKGTSIFKRTRDLNTGKETFSVESKKDNFTLTEYSDCSGTAKATIQVSDTVTQDIDIVWSLSGARTTGTIVSRSSDDSLNGDFSW